VYVPGRMKISPVVAAVKAAAIVEKVPRAPTVVLGSTTKGVVHARCSTSRFPEEVPVELKVSVTTAAAKVDPEMLILPATGEIGVAAVPSKSSSGVIVWATTDPLTATVTVEPDPEIEIPLPLAKLRMFSAGVAVPEGVG